MWFSEECCSSFGSFRRRDLLTTWGFVLVVLFSPGVATAHCAGSHTGNHPHCAAEPPPSITGALVLTDSTGAIIGVPSAYDVSHNIGVGYRFLTIPAGDRAALALFNRYTITGEVPVYWSDINCAGAPYLRLDYAEVSAADLYILPVGGSSEQLYVADLAADPVQLHPQSVGSPSNCNNYATIGNHLPALPFTINYTPPLKIEVR